MSNKLNRVPQIPSGDEQYHLLPKSHEEHADIVVFPPDIPLFFEVLSESGYLPESVYEVNDFLPDTVSNPKEYIEKIKKIESDPRIANGLAAPWVARLRELVENLNDKENWSVVQFVGDSFNKLPISNNPYLTKGNYYYWPTSQLSPVFIGVIDNAENVPVLYPLDKEAWKIIRDPTGMAARALHGEANSINYWYTENKNPSQELEKDLEKTFGKGTIPFGTAKSGSLETMIGNLIQKDIDKVKEEGNGQEWLEGQVDCPHCGQEVTVEAVPFVDAVKNPDLKQQIIDGTFFQRTCPSCGETLIVGNPCVYMDPEHSLIMQRGAELNEETLTLFAEHGSDYCRFTSSLSAFAEKVRIFSDGFNDGPMEILKFAIRGFVRQERSISQDEEIEVFFVGLDGDNILFEVHPKEETTICAINKGAYDVYAEQLRHLDVNLKGPASFFIDIKWAEDKLDYVNEVE